MIFINNEDVEKVLTIGDTLRVLEEGHVELAKAELVVRPRVDIYTETHSKDKFHRWGTMEGSSKGLHRHAIRMKSDIMSWPQRNGKTVEDKFCVRPGLFCGLIFLFDTSNGEPLALINDGYLQHIRVGALGGLGTKYLAKENASVVGILGSGGMARSHLMVFAEVRKIKKAKVYSPTRKNRDLFAKEMEEKLGFEVIPCGNPEEAVKGVDILATCTNSIDRTVFARMLEPGMHLTQVAGEYADDVYPKVDLCVGGDPKSQVIGGRPLDESQGFTTYLAGSWEALRVARGSRQGQAPHGDRILAKEVEAKPESPSVFHGRRVPLVDLILGQAKGRLNNDEISASGGGRLGGGMKQGMQFVTVGSLVYDLAKQAKLGKEVPTEWFLQDIRD